MAQKIYVGQTALTMELDTKIDLTTATVALMKYIKPDGTTGSWTATISATPEDGIISYDIASVDDLDTAGKWCRWAYVTFTGGDVAPGDSVNFTVYEQGC